MNKRGMFFTLMVIAILSLFLITYTSYYVIKDRSPIKKRVETLNNFVFSIENDLPRQLYISGFRIIFILEKKIIDNGEYIDDLNASFQELFFEGSIDVSTEVLMRGANFTGIQEFIGEKANKINAKTELSNPVFFVTQDDPWHVKLSLTFDLFVADNTNLSFWNKTSTVVSYIPIENFEDPVYTIGSGGVLTNKISKTIYEPFVSGDDVSNLTSHVNPDNSYYIASARAPSFLDRLQGINAPNENGIESLVYVPELSSPHTKSVVDFIYFSDNNPAINMISGMPGWFRLDNESLGIYGVEDLAG